MTPLEEIVVLIALFALLLWDGPRLLVRVWQAREARIDRKIRYVDESQERVMDLINKGQCTTCRERCREVANFFDQDREAI